MNFTVTSAANNGNAGTLLWAIQQANANNPGNGSETITFNIGNAGSQQTISLDANRGPLPAITDQGLLINGYSLGRNIPGIYIQVNGVNVGMGYGSTIQAGGVSVCGLDLANFSTGDGIEIANPAAGVRVA
jgi:hypothetical protein